MGERIKFRRGNQVYTGKIIKVKSTCVIVEVSVATQMKFNIDTNLTVVNFKNILEGPKLKPVKGTKNRFQIRMNLKQPLFSIRDLTATELETAATIGVTKRMLSDRRKQGWTKQRALTEPYIDKSEAGRRGKEALLKQSGKVNTIV